ncbi:MAG: dephospho-CoA kinase [Spirochaetales bacterium]|nr:dephospho-CoA kinase [Spirochaetales bacterium]
MVLGLAGKYCAGKNLAATILKEQGYSIIDVDALGHEALAACREAIVSRFGADILSSAGDIDRKKLGTRVFGDPEELAALESLVHPWMIQQVETRLLEKDPSDRMVINAALLFPLGFDSLCQAVIWVRSPFFLRFFRALRRDKLKLKDIIRRFRSQRKLSPQSPGNHVDIYYIDNTRGPEKVHRDLCRVLARLY